MNKHYLEIRLGELRMLVEHNEDRLAKEQVQLERAKRERIGVADNLTALCSARAARLEKLRALVADCIQIMES